MIIRHALLATSLLFATSCRKKAPDPPIREKKPAPTPVVRIHVCQSDQDCVITHKKPGTCCLGCLGRAVHRQHLQELRLAEAKRCRPGTFACPKIDCARPKVKPAARCEKGRCVTRYVPRVTRTDIDIQGRYRVTSPLPPRYPCRKAADCALTRVRPGHCCLTECPDARVAGTRAWVAAVEALRKKRCSAWLLQSSMGCSYPKCDPKGRPEARCEKGRCAVRYKPLR